MLGIMYIMKMKRYGNRLDYFIYGIIGWGSLVVI